jgi:hypothetical protein
MRCCHRRCWSCCARGGRFANRADGCSPAVATDDDPAAHPCVSHGRASRPLTAHEFIRRFLMHVLPAGFHRIRYYALLASGQRAENIARARKLLAPPIIPIDAIKAMSANAADTSNAAEPQTINLCPCCGGRMIIIERFERGATPHYRASPPTSAIRIDTS